MNTRSKSRKREAVQDSSDDEGSDRRPRKVLVTTMNDAHDSDSSEDVPLRKSQRTGITIKFTRTGPGRNRATVSRATASQSAPNPRPKSAPHSEAEAGLRRSTRRTVLTSTPQTLSASLPAPSAPQPEARATVAEVALKEQSPTDAALRWLDVPPPAVPKAVRGAPTTRQDKARAREDIQRTKTVAKLSSQSTTSRKSLAGRGNSIRKKVNNLTLSASLPAPSTPQPEARATVAEVALKEQSPTDAALRWLDVPPLAVPKAARGAPKTRQDKARAREEIQRTKTVAKLSSQSTTSRKGLAGRGNSIRKKVNNSEPVRMSTGINKPQSGHSPSPPIPQTSPLLREPDGDAESSYSANPPAPLPRLLANDKDSALSLLDRVTSPAIRPTLLQHKKLRIHSRKKVHVREQIQRKKLIEEIQRKKLIGKHPKQSKLLRVRLVGRGEADRKRISQPTKTTPPLKVDFESEEWAGIGETILATSVTVSSLEETEELNVERMLLPSPTSQPRSSQLQSASDGQSPSTPELPRSEKSGEAIASNSNLIDLFDSSAHRDLTQTRPQDLSDVANTEGYIPEGSLGFNNALQVNFEPLQPSLTPASLHLDSQHSQNHATVEDDLNSGARPKSSKHPYGVNHYDEISTVHDRGSSCDLSDRPRPRNNISAIVEARTLDQIEKIKTSDKFVAQTRFPSTSGSRSRQRQFVRDKDNKEIAHSTALSPILVTETDLEYPPQDMESSSPPRQSARWQSPETSREDFDTLMREIENDENMTDAEDSASDKAPSTVDDVWGTEVQPLLPSVERSRKPGAAKQFSGKAIQAYDTQTEDLLKRCNAVLDRAEQVLPMLPAGASPQYATFNDFARNRQAPKTRSGARKAPQPRRPTVNATRARMRKYINDQIGRPNLRTPPPFVPADQLMPNPGGGFALKQEPITSEFNQLSVRLLVQTYISARASDLPRDGNYREEVESYFFHYIGHIYSRAAKMEDERRCDEIKRAARHGQRKQKKIVRRMKAASEIPAYRRHVPMVSQMGVQAMSSEDTLSEGEGFLTRGVPWLSEEATDMLHGLDDAETYLLQSTTTQRHKPLPRITGPLLESRKLRLGLPLNTYNSGYLESREQDPKPSDEMYDFSLDQSVRASVEQRKSSKGKGRVR